MNDNDLYKIMLHNEIIYDYNLHQQKFKYPMTFEDYYEYRKELVENHDIYEDHSLYGNMPIDCVFTS